MIKLYNFDELKPEEILNRDIRAEKNGRCQFFHHQFPLPMRKGVPAKAFAFLKRLCFFELVRYYTVILFTAIESQRIDSGYGRYASAHGKSRERRSLLSLTSYTGSPLSRYGWRPCLRGAPP